ncbi:ADP-ribosylglycohydrolase family protein [Escherichia coli]|nr:ADP-ribosylglycohydrolase family protein [Escherichia coli]
MGVIFSTGRCVSTPLTKNVLGPTSKIALNAIRDGKPAAELENNGVTNGAAMRVSPLGCLLPARDVDSFIDDVALASSPTHKSDLAVAGGGSHRMGDFSCH